MRTVWALMIVLTLVVGLYFPRPAVLGLVAMVGGIHLVLERQENKMRRQEYEMRHPSQEEEASK